MKKISLFQGDFLFGYITEPLLQRIPGMLVFINGDYASPNKGARMDFAKLNKAFDIIASGTSIELTG